MDTTWRRQKPDFHHQEPQRSHPRKPPQGIFFSSKILFLYWVFSFSQWGSLLILVFLLLSLFHQYFLLSCFSFQGFMSVAVSGLINWSTMYFVFCVLNCLYIVDILFYDGFPEEKRNGNQMFKLRNCHWGLYHDLLAFRFRSIVNESCWFILRFYSVPTVSVETFLPLYVCLILAFGNVRNR